VTIAPDTAQKLYWVRNTTSQDVILSQGSGADVTIPPGAAKAVYANGAGAGAAVFDLTGVFSGDVVGNVTGNLTGNVTGNVTGDVTGNVTGNAGTATALQTARNFTVGATTRSFNGTAAVSWTLTEIGAQAASAQLTSVAALATNGLIARTAANTVTARTLTGTANQITVTNGDGVSGNPTVSAVIATQAEAQTGTDTTKLMTPLRVRESVLANAPAPAQLTQGEAENPASTAFGTVSGQRLEQSINANFNASGSAPKYACRAWVNFDGTLTSGNLRQSRNVSSVVRTATGLFTVNYATAMPTNGYVALGNSTGNRVFGVDQTNTTNAQINVREAGSGVPRNEVINCFAVFA